MAFIELVADEEAPPAMESYFEQDRAADGYVWNLTRAFAHRPGVFEAWKGLAGAVRSNMETRRYELATLAAARRLRSSYCSLAHGKILAEQFLASEQVRAAVVDHRTAGLDEVDVAVMDLADKVAADATSVTADDVERLRGLGLTDAEIFDVVAAAALRCFFSKTLDGLGVQPDAAYAELEPGLRDALTVGRPIEAQTTAERTAAS
jgi:uncharacterized peroxidase-related enzyme